MLLSLVACTCIFLSLSVIFLGPKHRRNGCMVSSTSSSKIFEHPRRYCSCRRDTQTSSDWSEPSIITQLSRIFASSSPITSSKISSETVKFWGRCSMDFHLCHRFVSPCSQRNDGKAQVGSAKFSLLPCDPMVVRH